jgi:ADP-ribose pyrophosphatase YjhB (NUDIX family)
MTEIYYNHKLLGLSPEPPEFKDWEKWNIINNYSGKSELPKLLELLKEEPFLQNILLWCQNPDIILQDILTETKLVEAAGGIVENINGDFLFIKRLGNWDLPKGKIEKGETIEETALREIEEECGITNLELGTAISETFHLYVEKDILILKKSYWFNVKYNGTDMNLVPQLNENITEAKWFNKSNINQIKENTYPSILSVLQVINL